MALHGRPCALRVDNGPELTAEAFAEWCSVREIEIRYIQPGKPGQNAYIERFNRSYRQDVLDAYVFSSLEEVRSVTEEWIEDYNTARPHDSLGRVPPLTFLPRHNAGRAAGVDLRMRSSVSPAWASRSRTRWMWIRDGKVFWFLRARGASRSCPARPAPFHGRSRKRAGSACSRVRSRTPPTIDSLSPSWRSHPNRKTNVWACKCCRLAAQCSS